MIDSINVVISVCVVLMCTYIYVNMIVCILENCSSYFLYNCHKLSADSIKAHF